MLIGRVLRNRLSCYRLITAPSIDQIDRRFYASQVSKEKQLDKMKKGDEEIYDVFKQRREQLLRETKMAAEDWKPIYRFNGIKLIGFFARLKIWQTGLVVTCVPLCYYMMMNDQISREVFITSANVATFAMLMLYVITLYTQRVVGVISVSKDGSMVRVGYLTFWGFRRNAVIPVDDIIPFGDMASRPKDLYLPIKRYSDSKFQLYLSKKKFTLVDDESFIKVFGVLS